MASGTLLNIKELLGITQEIFPEISCLIQIILTYPVTSSEGERSFGLLCRVLNWNRSSMTSDHETYFRITAAKKTARALSGAKLPDVRLLRHTAPMPQQVQIREIRVVLIGLMINWTKIHS